MAKLYPVKWTPALIRRTLRPRSVDRPEKAPSPDCGQQISAIPRAMDIQAANGRFAETPIRGQPVFQANPDLWTAENFSKTPCCERSASVCLV